MNLLKSSDKQMHNLLYHYVPIQFSHTL